MNYFLPVQMGAPDCFKYSVRRVSTLPKLNKVTIPELQISSNIKYYLTGLWEGDGHIWIPTTKNAPSGKNYTPLPSPKGRGLLFHLLKKSIL